MNEWVSAFTLGNAAILTNACLLPLYPGLIAFLAGNAQTKEKRSTWGMASLGVLVLAGVLTTMLLFGFLLAVLSVSAGAVLPILLPIIYVLVILFGLALLAGRNPFAALQTAQAPMLRNPYLTAYVYGLFFGPMTLPCTAPIMISAFALATGVGDVVDGVLYFFFFGLGFGWPLVVLPLIALPLQRRIVGWLSQQHEALNRASGILLIAVGIFGIITELVPQLNRDFELDQTAQLLYWVAAAIIVLAVGYFSLHHPETAESQHQATQ